MPSSVPRYAVKRLLRLSLASIGIPDHGDVLAVYMRWARQRYYRATQAVMRQEAACAVASTWCSPCDAEADQEQDITVSPSTLRLDAERLGVDLLGIGTRFESEESSVHGYPAEIDVVE